MFVFLDIIGIGLIVYQSAAIQPISETLWLFLSYGILIDEFENSDRTRTLTACVSINKDSLNPLSYTLKIVSIRIFSKWFSSSLYFSYKL